MLTISQSYDNQVTKIKETKFDGWLGAVCARRVRTVGLRSSYLLISRLALFGDREKES